MSPQGKSMNREKSKIPVEITIVIRNRKSKIYYQSSDDISSNLATSANCSVNNLHQLSAAKEGLHLTVNSFIIHIIHHVDTKSNILTKHVDVL